MCKNHLLNKSIIEVLEDKPSDITPIWLMRQAGRYLPEYRALRSNTASFMDAVLTPEIATEITLQPIKRFDLNAAIIFSDILVLPYAMGVDVQFHEGIGPVLQYDFNPSNAIANLHKGEKFHEVIKNVCQTVSSVKKSLIGKNIATIGFAGAPWTVACYMLEKNRKKGSEFDEARKIAHQFPFEFQKFLEEITDSTIHFLSAQIIAGAEVVKVFDSHAGILGEHQFKKFVIQPMQKIVKAIKTLHPQVPIIGFPRNAGLLYKNFAHETGVNCLAIDHTVPLDFAKETLQTQCVVQGNLENILLTIDLEHSQKPISDALDTILGKLHNSRSKRFICNLGHGCLPGTKIENIEFLIKKVRNFQKE
jgi:uroporphyrinogen decarboxylase